METVDSNESWRRRTALAVPLISLLLGCAFVVSAAATYDLSVSNSIDGPEQEVTVEGETFQVSSLSHYEQGDSIEAAVSRSGDEGSEYKLLLYDSDRQIEKTTRFQSGDASFTFESDELDPGTYILVVDDNGFQAVHPVVIQGYDISMDTRSTVATGESWTATASLDAYDDAPSVHAVEFVFLGEEKEKRFRATETDAGTYEAEVTAPDGAGQYSFGVIVRGQNEVEDGEYEPVAVSRPVTLDVQDGESDGDGGQSGAGGEDPQTTATPTNGTATATPDGSPTPTTTDARSDEDPTPTETGDPDGPVTPVEPTETAGSGGQVSEGADVDYQAGFGAGAALAALLAALTLLAQRR